MIPIPRLVTGYVRSGNSWMAYSLELLVADSIRASPFGVTRSELQRCKTRHESMRYGKRRSSGTSNSSQTENEHASSKPSKRADHIVPHLRVIWRKKNPMSPARHC